MRRTKAIILLAFWLSSGLGVVAQEQAVNSVDVVGPGRCYENELFIDVLAQHTPPDTLIIVIARLGEGEGRAGLNRRRLHNVRTYWTEYRTEKRSPETVILAEGERVTGHGRLEFYVGGKLAGMLKLRRNADLIAFNCYPEPEESSCQPIERNFYPCLDKRPRRKRR